MWGEDHLSGPGYLEMSPLDAPLGSRPTTQQAVRLGDRSPLAVAPPLLHPPPPDC